MIAEVARQVLSAIVFFHAKGIVFSNLSPEVVLSDAQSDSKFDSPNINVMLINTDLSCAQTCSGLRISSKLSIFQEITPNAVSDKQDIWTIGVLLHLLLTGNFPTFKNNQLLFDG